MTEPEKTKLAFDVDAALIGELGERLVAKRSVALAELIKNAYDADATEVILSFEDVTSSRGSIVVVDDGLGMSLEAMKRGWMRIATNDASVNSKSVKFGRPRTGAKGVGRFACGRLASRLSLESVSRVPSGSERVSAEFDWHDFKPGRDLAEVTANVTRDFVADNHPTGTMLRLGGLVDTWAIRDLDELQVELGQLMKLDDGEGRVHRDIEYEPDPGFRAQIIAPEFPRFEGDIGDPFIESAWGLLRGIVTDQGVVRYSLDILDAQVRLRHEPSNRVFKSLAGVKFTIRMMVYRGDRFRGSGFSLTKARQLGRERGGVRIYLDGFQVFSYGSPGDDWLDLDQDRARRLVTISDPALEEQATGLRRPMLSLPGNMQLFGAVTLTRERNPGLVASISRERLVQNESYNHLKQFVRDGIDWMTVCYARDQAKARDAGQADMDEKQTAAQALLAAREVAEGTTGIPDDVRLAIKNSLDEAETFLSQESRAHATELSMLRVLASAGTTVMVFDHTLRAMAGQLGAIADKLESTITFVPPDQVDGFQQTLDDLRYWSSVATGQGWLVGLLVGPEARTRRKSHAIRPFVEKLKRGFSGYMLRFGIALEVDIVPSVRTPPLYEAEVYAVLLNLLTNSYKAVREGVDRRVRIQAVSSRDALDLIVCDTGVGIPIENRTDVFDPFFTTSQPDPVFGIGTGLGLTIVRDLARSWGGDVSVGEPERPWSTAVKLTIPNRVTS